jgi:hypothetical protein
MAHTPGPWKIRAVNKQRNFGVVSDSDVSIARVSANIDRNYNARLIAAAPELLGACKLMLVLHPHNVTLQAAIDKAEGRT